MDFLIGACSDIGNSKSTNQDSYYGSLVDTSSGPMAFGVVCDGMGGLQKGEIASNSLMQAFVGWSKTFFQDVPFPFLSLHLEEQWKWVAQEYNEKIKQYGQQEGMKLGTTLTVLLLHRERYYVLNVGDTRCYRLGAGLSLITHDHSLVQREVDEGNLTPEEAELDPRRNVLLQCVGASETIRPDFFEGEYRPGDAFLLCTDGFRHVISKEEMTTALSPSLIHSEKEIENRISYLVETVKARREKDNITALLIKAE